MHIPWYRRFWSYIQDIPVEKVHSEYSGTLEVSLHRGEWKLSTYNAIYSFGRYYSSYKSAFRQLGLQAQPAETVLILGAGLGSIARLLQDFSHIRKITAVDIDPAIIRLARKYWPELPGVQTELIQADALQWLKDNRDKKFDLVLPDVFIDDKTPEKIQSEAFLSAARQVLKPDGILIYSRLNFIQQHELNNVLFEANFKKVFPNGFSLKAGYNKMFVNINTPESGRSTQQ